MIKFNVRSEKVGYGEKVQDQVKVGAVKVQSFDKLKSLTPAEVKSIFLTPQVNIISIDVDHGGLTGMQFKWGSISVKYSTDQGLFRLTFTFTLDQSSCYNLKELKRGAA